VAKVCKRTIGVQVQEKVTSEITKSVLADGNDPCTTAATSPSTRSMDAIDMNVKGVKETKGPVASLITTAGDRKRCFARQSDDHAAEVHKPNIRVQVQEEKVTYEISKSVLGDGNDPCTSVATSPSTSSMDAIDMYLKGVK
jgi:hypothetical protein